MESIAYASGFKNKDNLIKHIIKTIDPITFLSLDNGHLFTAFMEEPLSFSNSNKSEIYNEWFKYYENNQKYNKILNISVFRVGDKHEQMKTNLQNIKILRQLIIFKSFKNFVKYLRSDSNKNPQHFYDLMHRMGVLLAIWHRNSATSASMICPGYTNLNELVYIAKQHDKVAMILEDTTDYFYEPLEMKVRSKEGVSLFPVTGPIGNSVKNLLLNSCKINKNDEVPLIENIFVEMIRSLEVWTELKLAPRASPFLFKTVLLRADGKLYGFLTNNNMLITCPNENINVVTLLFKVCKMLKNIEYIEDISNERIEITFMATTDFMEYITKIKSIGLGIETGNISQISDDLKNGPVGLRGSMNLPIVPHGLFLPLVQIIKEDDKLQQYQNTKNNNNKKLFQLQNAVAKEILKHYEVLVVPLLKENKKKRINTLLHVWHKLPQADLTKVQIILEELPLDNKDDIVKYINNIGIDERVRIYLASNVYETSKNKDWLFSQAAVEEGLPHNVYISNKQFIPSDYNAVIAKQTSEAVLYNDNFKPVSDKKPGLINESTGNFKTLPKKWTKGWLTFKVLHQNTYKRESLPELFTWIVQKINGTTQFISWEKDIESIRNTKLQKIYNSYDASLEMLDIESSLFNAWNVYLNKKYKTAAEMMKSNYNIIRTEWSKLVQLNNNLIYPMDIDLDTCAQLLNISILVLFRTKYGTTKEIEEQYKRGDIEDLVTSANLFTGGNDYLDRPCIILYREKEPKVPFIKYSVLLNTNEKVSDSVLYNKCLYSSVNDMPEDLVALVKALRRN